MIRTVFVVLCAAPLLFGQTESNTLRITASRPVNTPLDQVVFSFAVYAPLAYSLDDVLTGLSSLGMAANPTNVFGPIALDSGPSTHQMLEWSFTLRVAYSTAADAAAALASLHGPLMLAYASSSRAISTQAQTTEQCAASDLVSDARAQAQKIATASGFTVGPILAISDTSGASLIVNPLIPNEALVVYDPLTGLPFTLACTLVVDFNVERFQ